MSQKLSQQGHKDRGGWMKKKPRQITLSYCGSFVQVKADSKMSNAWINNSPISLKDAKKLKAWLTDFIAYSTKT